MDKQYSKNELEEAKSHQKLASDVQYIKEKVDSIERNIKQEYITRGEHDILKNRLDLIQTIVFGFVSLVLLGFGGAIVAFFIK